MGREVTIQAVILAGKRDRDAAARRWWQCVRKEKTASNPSRTYFPDD
jgi:hypothetical protein